MDVVEFIPIVISIVSRVISISSVAIAWRLGYLSLRTSTMQEHFRALLQLDCQMINRPDLAAIYDYDPLSQKKSMDPIDVAKRTAFIYLYFNIFENVFIFYKNILGKKQNSMDKMSWEAWDRYIRRIITDSSEARALFRQERAKEAYSSDFIDNIYDIIEEVENKKTVG
jgi:hypothetical protein